VLIKAGLQRGAVRHNADGSLTQLFAWHAGIATECRLTSRRRSRGASSEQVASSAYDKPRRRINLRTRSDAWRFAWSARQCTRT
jgi:hypothetical protein